MFDQIWHCTKLESKPILYFMGKSTSLNWNSKYFNIEGLYFDLKIVPNEYKLTIEGNYKNFCFVWTIFNLLEDEIWFIYCSPTNDI